MGNAEKFIQEHTHNCFNYNSYSPTPEPWLTPDQARRAVEIAREEMTEKAFEYLYGLIELLNDYVHVPKKERIINGLKQAMKDE